MKNIILFSDRQRRIRGITDWCVLNDDKSEVDCTSIKFIGQTVDIRIKVNQCQEPVTLTFNIVANALGELVSFLKVEVVNNFRNAR